MPPPKDNILADYQPLAALKSKAAQVQQELDALRASDKQAAFKDKLSVRIHEEPSSSMRRPRPSTAHAALGSHSAAAATAAAGGKGRSRGFSGVGVSVNDPAGPNSGDDSPHNRTPGGSRKSVGSGLRSPSIRMGMTPALMEQYQAAVVRVHAAEEEMAMMKARMSELVSEAERRQASYMRREEALQAEVAGLQDKLRLLQGEKPPASKEALAHAGQQIRQLHSQVVSQLDTLLGAATGPAGGPGGEQAALRRFGARLDELQAQVTLERNAGASKGEAEWMGKTLALRSELDATQSIAQSLDAQYKTVAEEASRAKSQVKLLGDDRDYLIKQTVLLKKDVTLLRNELTARSAEALALAAERDQLASALAMLAGQVGGGGAAAVVLGVGARGPAGLDSKLEKGVAIKVQRYEDVISSLQKLLEAERKRTKAARAAHTSELASRTGLQALLRQCVEDVREQRRAAETTSAREVARAGRAEMRARPVSARPPSTTSRQQPFSAALAAAQTWQGPGAAGVTHGSAHGQRPLSATLPRSRGGGLGYGLGSLEEGGGGPGSGQNRQATAESVAALDASGRAELISRLLSEEALLQQLFEHAFPGVAPAPPADPFLEQVAALQEARDHQVVAQARLLGQQAAAATGGTVSSGGLIPSSARRLSSSGDAIAGREGGGGGDGGKSGQKPWVLDTGAMMASFLKGGPK